MTLYSHANLYAIVWIIILSFTSLGYLGQPCLQNQLSFGDLNCFPWKMQRLVRDSNSNSLMPAYRAIHLRHRWRNLAKSDWIATEILALCYCLCWLVGVDVVPDGSSWFSCVTSKTSKRLRANKCVVAF